MFERLLVNLEQNPEINLFLVILFLETKMSAKQIRDYFIEENGELTVYEADMDTFKFLREFYDEVYC